MATAAERGPRAPQGEPSLTGEAPDVGAAAGDVALFEVHQRVPARKESRLRGAQVGGVHPEGGTHARAVLVSLLQRLATAAPAAQRQGKIVSSEGPKSWIQCSAKKGLLCW